MLKALLRNVYKKTRKADELECDYLLRISFLVTLICQKEASQDQIHFLLDRLKPQFPAESSIEKIVYLVTDQLAVISNEMNSKLIIDKFRSIERKTFFQVKKNILEQNLLLADFGDYRNRREVIAFIQAISVAMGISDDVFREVEAWIICSRIQYAQGEFPSEYENPLRIINDALARSKI